MDKLTRLAQEHGEVFETLAFFKESMSKSIVDNQKSPYAYITDLSNFFDQYVVDHFKFEENEIFPVVLSVGKAQERRLVRILQREHIDILDKLDQIKDLILKSGFPTTSDGVEMNELANLTKEIVKMTLEHARKEDEQLYPFLKSIGFRFNQSV